MTSAMKYATNARKKGRHAAEVFAERLRLAVRKGRNRRLLHRHGNGTKAAMSRGDGGTRTEHREQERKFDVPPTFELPHFEDIAGLTVLADEEVDLDAMYYDTPDLRLTRSGVSLRYRNDEGWTVKLPDHADVKGLVRRENHFPGGPDDPPTEASNLVTGWARREALRPVAKLETRRHRIELGNDQSKPVAEVADDRVRASSPAVGSKEFRQIEIELLDDSGSELQKRIVSRVRAAGATNDSGEPKIKLALGKAAFAPSELDAAMPSKTATVRDVAQSAIVASAQRLVEHDAAVRLGDDPEGVHQARVATRRLRSDLKTFRPVLERAITDPVRDELRWLATRLGGVRDADVLGELLRARIATLGKSDSKAAHALLGRLDAERAGAREILNTAMTSGRYKQLLERIVELAQAPPVNGKGADRKAKKALPQLVRRPWRRLRRFVKRMSGHPSDADLHEVRKLAKQARYAAEAAAPVIGKRSKRFAKAMERVQDHLGAHQDAVVAYAWLEDAARNEHDPGTILLAGEVAGLCVAERDRLHRKWPGQWRRARGRKLHGWL